MAGINVGTAFVTIIPSARGFKNQLRKELSGELELLARNAGKTLEKGIAKAKLKQTLEKSLSVASTAALVASLASVSGAAVTLASSLLPVAGIMTALPAAAGVGAAAMATLKLGISGVSDAFSAFADGDPKKIEKALEGLSPSARKFVKDFAGGFKGLQQVAQESMFKPISKVSGATAKTLEGPLKTGFKQVGTAIGDVSAKVVKFAGSRKGVQLVMNAFSNAETFIKGASKGLDPLMNGLADLANVFFPRIGKSGDAVGKTMAKLGKWLTKISQNGKALTWMDGAKDAASKLWGIAKNLLKTLLGIFGASDSGGDMLGTIEKITAKMEKWVNSAGGQEKLAQTFKTLNQILTDLAGVFAIVGGGVALLVGWFNQLSPGTQSVVTQIIAFGAAAKLLSGPLGLIAGTGGKLFTFFKSVPGGVSPAKAAITKFGTALGNGKARFQLYAEAAGNGMKRAGSAIKSGATTAGTYLSGLASKAGTAASALGSKLSAMGTAASGAASRAGTALSGLASKAGTAASTAGGKIGTLASKFGSMAAQAASASAKAVAAFGRMAATAAASVGKQIASLAILGAKWVWYGIMAMANAIRAAAAWVISLGPIAWIIAAVVALVALIIVYWDEIVAALETAWNFISSLAKTVWNGILAFFKGVWDGLVAIVMFVVNLIKSIIVGYFTMWYTIIKTVMTGIVTFFKVAWAWIKNVVVTVTMFVVNWIRTKFMQIKAFITMVWTTIKAAIARAWALIKTVVVTVTMAVVNWIKTKFTQVKAFIAMVWDTITGVFKTVWEAIKNVVKSAIARVKGIIEALAAIPGKVKAWFNRAKEGAMNALGKLISWVKGVPGKVLSALGKVGSKLLGAGKDLIGGLLKGIKNGANAIWNWVKGFLGGFKDKVLGFFGIKSPSRLMMYVGDMIVAGLVKALYHGENAALKAAQAVAAAAKPDVDTTFGGGYNGIGPVGAEFSGSGTYVANMQVTAVGRPFSVDEVTRPYKFTGASS